MRYSSRDVIGDFSKLSVAVVHAIQCICSPNRHSWTNMRRWWLLGPLSRQNECMFNVVFFKEKKNCFFPRGGLGKSKKYVSAASMFKAALPRHSTLSALFPADGLTCHSYIMEQWILLSKWLSRAEIAPLCESYHPVAISLKIPSAKNVTETDRQNLGIDLEYRARPTVQGTETNYYRGIAHKAASVPRIPRPTPA